MKKNNNYVVATIKSWNVDMFNELSDDLSGNWHLIDNPKELTLDRLKKINPRYVFFPHWSWIISEKIHQSFECIIFHMADLPYGRGGSPLQNLIVRGHTDTKISALKCSSELDAGPVYLKLPLSLYGTAEEIFLRASRQIFQMIDVIAGNELEPEKQVGDIVEFSRRKGEEGRIDRLDSLEKVFDYIRMLDAEGYPPAYTESGGFRFEFSRVSLKHDRLLADVVITQNKSGASNG